MPMPLASSVLRGLVFAIGAASCTSVLPTATVAPLAESFKLRVGQTAAITGTNVRVKFDRVVADSRCPIDVQCVWAGSASIVFDSPPM